jgi:hypothetical protein
MSREPIPWASKLVRGALVQLIPDIIAFIPNIVIFQYNPEKITRGMTPYVPDSGSQPRTEQSADTQPFDPEETISFTLELSATEGMEHKNPVTIATGIASQLAALRKMLRPTSGLLSDLKGSAQALANKSTERLTRPTLPVTFLIYGPGLIVPVRITEFSVEEVMHTPLLYPHEAKVTIKLLVLTPDKFKCSNIRFRDLAISAYNLTRAQEDALAVANIANHVEEVLGVLI